MSTFVTIKKNQDSKFGIDLVIGDQSYPITQKTPDGFYHLPENPIRKYIMIDLVNYHLENADSFVLNQENCNPKNFGVKNSVEKKVYPKGQSSRVKSLKLSLDTIEEYLETDEEKSQWNDLMGIVTDRYEKKMAQLEEERKAKSKIEKSKNDLQKALETLKKAGIDISALIG